MPSEIYQGEVLEIEGIKDPVIVVSKPRFNMSGTVVGCPFLTKCSPSALHIKLSLDDKEGCAICEDLRLIDLRVRGHHRLYRLSTLDTMEVADAVQSIFDYIYQ
ncbi:MAG: type II toxin-antitoxin system PemK/MazF family toxin [Lachnospiraceae bacterium]|nr:type II toxin-antitoxin system PemK/MazF family toxin [Lachnospiraceae bacterium]